MISNSFHFQYIFRGMEYPDPGNECFKYVCTGPSNNSNRNQGYRIFDDKKCCQFNNINIQVGKTVEITDFDDEGDSVRVDDNCYGRFASCQAASLDMNHPNLIIHDVENVKCCTYNNKAIALGEMILDAEVSLSYRMHDPRPLQLAYL